MPICTKDVITSIVRDSLARSQRLAYEARSIVDLATIG
jgi:hypothetical protein